MGNKTAAAGDDQEFVDLSSLEALVQRQNDGIDIEILNEAGKPLGLKIGIVGPDSDRMQKAMREVSAEFAAAAADRESLEDAGNEADERMIAILAKATIHWSPNPKIGGAVVPFTEANVRNLYSKFRIIRDQVEAKAVRRTSFAQA